MKFKKDDYSFGKIDAIQQFHIVRKVAPIVGDLLAVISNSGVIKSGQKLEGMKLDDIDFDALAKDLGPLLTTLAKLPEEDVNFVLFSLLKSVQRKATSAGGYSPIMTSQNHFMFEDIKNDLQLMMSIVGHAFVHNLSGFISALPSGLKEGALHSQQNG